MRFGWGVAAILAAGQMSAAWAQATKHDGHAKPAAAKPAPAPAAPVAPAVPAKYVSAFDGYRPFTAEEPLKDWRRANDEVRDAGGHVGIMKATGEPAQLTGHGAHGAKQPVGGDKK